MPFRTRGGIKAGIRPEDGRPNHPRVRGKEARPNEGGRLATPRPSGVQEPCEDLAGCSPPRCGTFGADGPGLPAREVEREAPQYRKPIRGSGRPRRPYGRHCRAGTRRPGGGCGGRPTTISPAGPRCACPRRPRPRDYRGQEIAQGTLGLFLRPTAWRRGLHWTNLVV